MTGGVFVNVFRIHCFEQWVICSSRLHHSAQAQQVQFLLNRLLVQRRMLRKLIWMFPKTAIYCHAEDTKSENDSTVESERLLSLNLSCSVWKSPKVEVAGNRGFERTR